MASDGRLRYGPDYGVIPGEILQEALEERGMTQSDLARRTNRPIKTINEIINGKAAITPDTAIQLERVLGISSRFWNALERDYREHVAVKQERERLHGQTAFLDRFPIRELAEFNLLPRDRDKTRRLEALFSFFGVSSADAWEREWGQPQVAFRQSRLFEASPGAVAAWLRWGELEAARIPGQQIDLVKLRKSLGVVRSLTRLDLPQALIRTQELCAEAGVAVVFLPELKGSRLSGAAKWLTPDRALVLVSSRYRTDDHLWFTFFHECAHILLHGKRPTYLDEQPGLDDPSEDYEKEADRFARDLLVPRAAYVEFVERESFSCGAIAKFAEEIDVAPGAVLGRLQRDSHVGYENCRNLKLDVDPKALVRLLPSRGIVEGGPLIRRAS